MLSPRARRSIRLALGGLLLLYAAGTVGAAFLLTHPRYAKPFIRFQDLPVDPAGRAEAVEIRTEDGVSLRGSVAAPADPRGVLILLHGIGGSRLLGAAQRFAARGLVGVAFDFRGHGQSDGSATTYGWDERKDVAAIVAYARARWPGKRIAAWGLSLGGAALCYGHEVTRELDAVVLESVYSTLDSAFERRVTSHAPAFLAPLALPCRLLVEQMVPLDPALLQPIRYTGRLRPERTLITTGGRDPWATVSDLEELSRPLPGCTTHVVPGADHHDVWKVGGEAYLELVGAFVVARLR